MMIFDNECKSGIWNSGGFGGPPDLELTEEDIEFMNEYSGMLPKVPDEMIKKFERAADYLFSGFSEEFARKKENKRKNLDET